MQCTLLTVSGAAILGLFCCIIRTFCIINILSFNSYCYNLMFSLLKTLKWLCTEMFKFRVSPSHLKFLTGFFKTRHLFDVTKHLGFVSGWDLLWCLQEAHRQGCDIWIPRVPTVKFRWQNKFVYCHVPCLFFIFLLSHWVTSHFLYGHIFKC